MRDDALQLQTRDVMVFFSMVFAVFFIWHCHGIPSLFFWKIEFSLAPQFRACRTGLQRNGNFCIKELFFLCPVSWKVSWVMWNTAKRRVWHQSGTYCWTRFIDRWPQGGWNVFSRLWGHSNSQELFWSRTRNSFGSCSSAFLNRSRTCPMTLRTFISVLKNARKFPKRSITNVLKSARKLPKHSITNVLKSARELPKRSIKNECKRTSKT